MIGRTQHERRRTLWRPAAGRLHLRPTGPLPVGALTITGLTVAGERLDLTIDSDGRIESVSAPAGLTVEKHPAPCPTKTGPVIGHPGSR